jgi:uncharacterized protein YkwD
MRKIYRLPITSILGSIFLSLSVVACGSASEPKGGLQITVTVGGLDQAEAVDAAPPDSPGPLRVDTPEPTVLITVPPDVPSMAATPSLDPHQMLTHAVQDGDTLLGLARQYAVPMAAIQLANGMGDSTVVKLGQSLKIPDSVQWEGASPFWRLHTVSVGETLSEIARAYELDIADLLQVNDLDDADQVIVGQMLVLPLDGIADPQMPSVIEVPSPTETPAETEVAATLSPAAQQVDPTAAPVQISDAVPPSETSDWPYETVRLINGVRAAHGLPALIYNETLALAAQGQANDCAQRGWCSHTGSDGSDIKVRILRVGYEPSSWAECWAQRQTPGGAVNIWMDEVPPDDPHRRTLLTTWLSEIGVGVAETTWGYYFIADFGRP